MKPINKSDAGPPLKSMTVREWIFPKGKKPTRRDLLRVIGELQNIIGKIGADANDRNPNRATDIFTGVEKGMALCIKARSFDPPDDVG